MVYELFFSYYDQDPENDEEMIIAAYSSYEKAESARKKLLEQPRFKGKEDFFEIHDFKMNEPWWDDSENHNIEIRNQEDRLVYQGSMDCYYDHEKFLCLKNIESGEMYCLDKQQGKIQYEANTYEDMLKFVRQRYQIEIFGWKDIFRK